MPYFTASDGEKIYYQDRGKGEPLVLMHGFGMNSTHWTPFTLILSRHWRVITPDLRGFGQSHLATYSKPCVLSNFASDLNELLDHLQLKQIKLAGISMGALACLQYQALFSGKRLSAYMHIDQSPVCFNNKDWQWGLFGKDQAHRVERVLSLTKQLDPFLDQKTAYEDLPEHLKAALWLELGDFFASALSRVSHKRLARYLCAREWPRKHILPTNNWSAYICCLKAYLEQKYDLRQTLKRVQVPTTLIVGLDSEMYPKGGQLRIADYRKNTRIVAFERCGHTPLIDQPIRLLKELHHFAKC